MISINIHDETAPLEAVVLGTAENFGGTPSIEEAYDPKSIEHIKDNTFPKEPDLIEQLDQVNQVLLKYGVEVYRPALIPSYNQIFSRDIGIALGDQFILPTIFQDRSKEIEGLDYLVKEFDPTKLLHPEKHERMEGGDVIAWKGHLYVGYSTESDFKKYKVARTNEYGVDFLNTHFREWTVYAFELNKSDDDPRANALHLDCCFQPIGHDKAIIHKEGFKYSSDADKIVELFGIENIHFINAEEMYQMHSNIFSIRPDVIISDRSFTRLNAKLEAWGITVETVDYGEVSKMEGLLRCSTLPIRRTYV